MGSNVVWYTMKKRVLVFGSSICGIGAEPGIYAAIKIGRMHAQKRNI